MGESRVGGARLAVGLGVVTLTLFAAYSGVLSVLLPTVVADIDPAGKVGSLALVTAVSFAVTALAQPLIGALSDRTRGRWGRRSPWMLAGAVIGGAAVAALGFADSIPLIVVLWAVGQFALNGTDIASTAFLVDRYPPARRVRVVAVFAGAAMGGGAVGAVVAGSLSASPMLAFGVLAVAVVIVVTAFVVLLREEDPPFAAEPLSVRGFFAQFLVDPRRHPDFSWLFAARLSFGVGHQAVYGYLLYLLTDHLELPALSAASLMGLITVVAAAAVAATIVAVAFAGGGARRRSLLVAAGLGAAAALGLLLMIPEVWTVFVVAALLGVSLGVFLVAGTSLVSEFLPGGDSGAGRGLGLYNVGTNIAQAIGPIVGAVAITHLGGYPALIVVALIAMLAAAALVLPVRRA